jgi:hypothetical protein
MHTKKILSAVAGLILVASQVARGQILITNITATDSSHYSASYTATKTVDN